MNRRSISLYPALETLIRDFQAELLRFLDRDVSFTEALNLVILGAIMAEGTEKVKKLGKDSLNELLNSVGVHREAIVDDLFDEVIRTTLPKGEK